jgi:hypothetical protein
MIFILYFSVLKYKINIIFFNLSISLSMYLLCIEGKGDGSCNFTGYCRPGINVYTTKEDVIQALLHIMEENNITFSDIFDDIFDDYFNMNSSDEDDSDVYLRDHDYSKLRDNKLCEIIIDKGGVKLDKFKWIRITEIIPNSSKYTNHFYDNWDI